MTIHLEATLPAATERVHELLTNGAKLGTVTGMVGKGGGEGASGGAACQRGWCSALEWSSALASGQQGHWQMAVGEIACRAVDSCAGIGAVGQGSPHAALYTNVGS